MAFDLSTTMDGIAAYAVAQGVTSRAYGWPLETPATPCLVVGYPTKLDFDLTFHALATTGNVSLTIPVYFVVGLVFEKSSRDALSLIITGATGIKEKFDGSMGGTFLQSARVVDVKVEPVSIGGNEYLAAHFDLEVLA